MKGKTQVYSLILLSFHLPRMYGKKLRVNYASLALITKRTTATATYMCVRSAIARRQDNVAKLHISHGDEANKSFVKKISHFLVGKRAEHTIFSINCSS